MINNNLYNIVVAFISSHPDTGLNILKSPFVIAENSRFYLRPWVLFSIFQSRKLMLNLKISSY